MVAASVGQPVGDRGQQLLGGDVPVQVAQRLVHDHPLGGHAIPRSRRAVARSSLMLFILGRPYK